MIGWCEDMTEEQLKQLTDFAAAKRTEDLLKIREEIAQLDDVDYDFEGYYKAVNDCLKIIDKHLSKPL